MTHKALCAILLCSNLVACAVDTATVPLQSEQAIRDSFANAQLRYKEKMAPIAQHLVKVCAPMTNPEYLRCIAEQRAAIDDVNIYPDSETLKDERRLLEQALLSGKIDRKQFRSAMEAARARADALRLSDDIQQGRYSGRY